jgi:hypothetical protein
MSSVCVNHPDRVATERCATCHKPVCGECVVKARNSVYCSRTCADNAAKFAGYKPESGPGLLATIKSWITCLVGLTFLAGMLVLIGAKVLNLGFCQTLLKKIGL